MVNDKFIFLFVLFLINIASTRKINDLEKKQFEDKKSTTNSIATGMFRIILTISQMKIECDL